MIQANLVRYGKFSWVAVFLIQSIAFAHSTHPTTEFPATMPAENHTLSLNGVGTRKATIFKVKVYDAALYLEKKSKNAKEILDSNQIKRVDMFFLETLTVEKSRMPGKKASRKIAAKIVTPFNLKPRSSSH